tara:strand:+ start:542 stop:904 length:363 start_codon:yes stop_codon:yes gene_type:complete
MDNFDYKKYLAEGKLLKENLPDNITSVIDAMLNEDFASKAQQKFLYANNPKAAKKLASKMSKKDYKNLPDKVNEGVEDNLWASYVKSLINDIRLNGIGEYGGASEGDIIEDFENYIADKF